VSRSELPDLTNLSGPPRISALASETTHNAQTENILNLYDEQPMKIFSLASSTNLYCGDAGFTVYQVLGYPEQTESAPVI
jgi:hypothetical protein